MAEACCLRKIRPVPEDRPWAHGQGPPGIVAERSLPIWYWPRIFRMFQTLAPPEEGESIGLGLALVKKIVERYGGKVWVESAVGQGSTFYFTWPQTKMEEPVWENR